MHTESDAFIIPFVAKTGITRQNGQQPGHLTSESLMSHMRLHKHQRSSLGCRTLFSHGLPSLPAALTSVT